MPYNIPVLERFGARKKIARKRKTFLRHGPVRGTQLQTKKKNSHLCVCVCVCVLADWVWTGLAPAEKSAAEKIGCRKIG